MSFITTLAQASNDYSYTYTTSTSSSTLSQSDAAVIIAVTVIGLVVGLIAYIVTAWLLGRIFKKAGRKAWPAWVPIYNNWVLLEIGGQKGWWAILSLVPIANIVAAVYVYIAAYHVGKKLGKDGVFILWYIFIPLVWFIWLAFDKSTWQDGGNIPTPPNQPGAVPPAYQPAQSITPVTPPTAPIQTTPLQTPVAPSAPIPPSVVPTPASPITPEPVINSPSTSIVPPAAPVSSPEQPSEPSSQPPIPPQNQN